MRSIVSDKQLCRIVRVASIVLLKVHGNLNQTRFEGGPKRTVRFNSSLVQVVTKLNENRDCIVFYLVSFHRFILGRVRTTYAE